MGLYEDLNDIIELYEQDELKHFEERDRPGDHVYLKLMRVKEWINSPYIKSIFKETYEEDEE